MEESFTPEELKRLKQLMTKANLTVADLEQVLKNPLFGCVSCSDGCHWGNKKKEDALERPLADEIREAVQEAIRPLVRALAEKNAGAGGS